MLKSRCNQGYRYFLQDESGLVTTDYVFFAACAVSSSLAVSGVLESGTGNLANDIVEQLDGNEIIFRSSNFGLGYEEYLTAYDWQTTTVEEELERFQTALDPNERADEDLQYWHSVWVERLADPSHSKHHLAEERLITLEIALQARGLEPLPGY